MSLDLICKEMTPYPHWTMEMSSGIGLTTIIVDSERLPRITAYGRTEQEAAEKMLKAIQKRKAENVAGN